MGKTDEARSVGDPQRQAVMGALYGVTLIGLTTIILMVDASTALPLSDVDEVAIEAQPGVVRTLLSAPVSLDSMLAQAEKLGSGESTFNMLTARPKQQPAPEAPVLFDYTPPNQLEEEADPEESLPLATFERKRALEEATEQNTAKLESSAASVSAEHQREEMLLQGIQVSQPTLSQVRTPAVNPNTFRLSAPQADQLTAVAELEPGAEPQVSLNDVLAKFNHEQTATISTSMPTPKPESLMASSPVLFPDVSPLQVQPELTSSLQQQFANSLASLGTGSTPQSQSTGPVTPLDIDDDQEDLGESDDVGNSATADSDDAIGVDTTQSMLGAQIEKEAAKAARSVLKNTMKTVENEFLMSEKQLTKDASNSSPALTLQNLRRPDAAAAQAQTKRRQDRASAKDEHKKMKLEAKLAYDRAVGAAHKVAKEQLDHTLAGLKMQLAQQKKSVSEDAKLQEEQAKQKMLDEIRTKEMVAVNRLQATLPGKMAQVKKKAEAQAQRVAVMAIQQVTSENHKLRESLSNELGEAREKLGESQLKLTNSDENPTAALQEAVDVKEQKAHVDKLGKLANNALTQQKARAASQVSKAQDDAKESVRLAMKSAQKNEVATARKQMAAEQKNIRQDAQEVYEDKRQAIVKKAKEAEVQLTAKTKLLVDRAIQRAPLSEAALGQKAKTAYTEATHAADQYLAKKIADATPDVQAKNGERINRDIAESAIENPTQSKEFTLANQNFEAAAKFAAQKARKAKRKLDVTRQKTKEMMTELSKETKEAKAAADKAEALDEKVTRIKLAKLQLHEARAANAFNKAARAHLQEEFAKKQMKQAPVKGDKALSKFQSKLKLLQSKAKTTAVDAFKMAA